MSTTTAAAAAHFDDLQYRRRWRIVKSELNGRNCSEVRIDDWRVENHCNPKDQGDDADMRNNRENRGTAGPAINSLVETQEHWITTDHQGSATTRRDRLRPGLRRGLRHGLWARLWRRLRLGLRLLESIVESHGG